MIDKWARSGFTLIELSIVLVIIGLIIGGVLAGQDLIVAAKNRAQISQIEKYQTAVRTFQSKYGYLPGDIMDPYATQFGFQGRGPYNGEGDGNGVLEGDCQLISTWVSGYEQGCGELPVFWEDLSDAQLVDVKIYGRDKKAGLYPSTTLTNGAGVTLISSPGVKDWIPEAKLGNGNFVYVD